MINVFSLFVNYACKCILTRDIQTKHELCTNSNPKCFSNPIHTFVQWWSTLLCAPHVPVAVAPWNRPSRPLHYSPGGADIGRAWNSK